MEINQSHSAKNKNPTILNMIGFRFYIRFDLLILYGELITKVMWFGDRHKIQDSR